MKTSELLIQAKQLIQDPANWMKEDYHKVIDGKECYCSLGAIARVMNPEVDMQIINYDWLNNRAERLLNTAIGKPTNSVTFAVFNDENEHEKVMEAFDKAIYLAQVEEGDVIKL